MTRLREVFSYFDLNADGTIRASDIPLAMRSTGALVTDREIKILIQKYDYEGTGSLTFDDYTSMLAEVEGKPDTN